MLACHFFFKKKEAANLLRGMLRCQPTDRFTLAEIMTHPWVNGERLQTEATPAAAATPIATTSDSEQYNDRCITIFCSAITQQCCRRFCFLVCFESCSNIGDALYSFFQNEKSLQNVTPFSSVFKGQLYADCLRDNITCKFSLFSSVITACAQRRR
jgi:serine/threonine protein kinase